MSTTQAEPRTQGQLRCLLRAAHPRQAVALAVAVGALVALMGRPAREVLVSAAAVLVTQLILGLVNDLTDVEQDRRSEVAGKPIASEELPAGNASFAALALTLVSIPLALQNGILAGLLLLATLVVGFVHNHWLHRSPLSFLGWTVTFALLTGFVSEGGWGRAADGTAPVTAFALLAAVLGVLVHFLTSLPDLVADDKAGVRNLPLVVALRTGAPRLLVITGVATLLVVVALVWTALAVGIAR
jgi:4-hydroxybenzoate polyprenyltransferase